MRPTEHNVVNNSVTRINSVTFCYTQVHTCLTKEVSIHGSMSENTRRIDNLLNLMYHGQTEHELKTPENRCFEVYIMEIRYTCYNMVNKRSVTETENDVLVVSGESSITV